MNKKKYLWPGITVLLLALAVSFAALGSAAPAYAAGASISLAWDIDAVEPVTVNGVTVSVSFDNDTDLDEDDPVEVTVAFTGEAEETGTLSFGISSVLADFDESDALYMIKGDSDFDTAGFTFTFYMPDEDVTDIEIYADFEQYDNVFFQDEEFVKGFNHNLELYNDWIGYDDDGLPTTMPIFTYGAAGYIRERVWVEVPCDTDRDGKRDRISLYICRPVTKDGFLCPVVMEFSPYHNGTVSYPRMANYINDPSDHLRGMAATFQYKANADVHLAINPDTTHLTYDDIKYKGIEAWDTIWWSTDDSFTVGSWYTGAEYAGTTAFTDEFGYSRTRKNYTGMVPPATEATEIGTADSHTWDPPARHRQFFVRGYACVYGQLLGNVDCYGITNSLHVEEWLSAAAAVKWFNGEAKAFTTRDGSIEVIAGWANGHVAMDGTSYPGTTPTVAAMAGCSGLKAIMPEANVTSWYEYYRSGGALHGPEGYGGEDMNLHSSYNFSRFNGDVSGNNNLPREEGPNFGLAAQQAYVETQFYMMEQQDRATADYNAAWDVRNLTRGYGKIPDDVGILQTNGQQDWNVMPRHAYMMLQALRDRFQGNNPMAYGTHKLVSGLSKHASQSGRLVPGTDGVERGMLKWYLMFLDHYLLGLDNQVDELMYDVNIADNISGVMEGYDYDTILEERGTIIPGASYEKFYLGPGLVGAAGKLVSGAPAETVEHFDDMTILEQLTAPLHLGVAGSGGTTARPSSTIGFSSGQGNYTPSTAQINWCDDRVIGINRSTYFSNADIFGAVDQPVEGRLLYLSDPLPARVKLSGTVVVHLNAAPTKAVGNLTVALVEIGRLPRVAVRIEGINAGTQTAVSVFPQTNGASAANASRYSNPVASAQSNFKYVTWGHTDVQNPSTDGKAWFQVPEHNYTPNFYFQTTAITPGEYYDYVVELNPYNYTFEKGMRMGIMVYGTDTMASPVLDAASTGGFDVKLGADTYADIPLIRTLAPQTEAPVITIDTQPDAEITVKEGNITESLSVEASVTPAATLTYQWYSTTSNSNVIGTAIAGATAASYSIPTDLGAGIFYYFCEVRSMGAVYVRSEVAKVIVTGVPYTITLNANGGKFNGGATTATIERGTGELYGSLPEPSYLGYSFAGWFFAADGDDKVVAEDIVTATDVHTLYAHWDKLSVGGGGGGGGGGGASSAVIAPTKATFDPDNSKDVTVTITLNGNKLVGLKNGNTALKEGVDYTVNGDTVTIKASYLASLDEGDTVITFNMNGGSDPKLTIIVKGAAALPQVEIPAGPLYKPMPPLHPAGTKVEATKTNNPLLLDGQETLFPAVKVGGYNWIKLRDFAMLLNGTAKQFSVAYDPATGIIDIRTGSAYQPVGDELTDKLMDIENALASPQKLRVNGEFVDVAAYNINGYNYFRVRDLAIILNFAVIYNEETGEITLDFANPYQE
jgi:predicted acyl esterase